MTLSVQEGPAYSWVRADWVGNKTLSATDLDRTLHMVPGGVADGSKIDEGTKNIQRACGKLGYIAAAINTEPSFDDQAKTVVYRMSVNEGHQFRMGTLSVTGLAESDAAHVKGKWAMAPGQVFDDSYTTVFGENLFKGGWRPSGGKFSIGFSIKPDQRTLTVDVSINFRRIP